MTRKYYIAILLFILAACSENSGIKNAEKTEKAHKDSMKVYIEKYPNGNIKSSKSVMNNELNGPVMYYYEDGKLKDSAFCVNGKVKGWQYTFHPNGAIRAKFEIMYFNNHMHVNQAYAYKPDGSLNLDSSEYFKFVPIELDKGKKVRFKLKYYSYEKDVYIRALFGDYNSTYKSENNKIIPYAIDSNVVHEIEWPKSDTIRFIIQKSKDQISLLEQLYGIYYLK